MLFERLIDKFSNDFLKANRKHLVEKKGMEKP